MGHPMVSIITPTYNHERFIAQCIESVLAQTYSHWQQIIIDDGSTDRTAQIVASFDDERINYIRQNNQGIWRLKDMYNNALGRSNGELIAVLEGDDFWPPDKLELQVNALDGSTAVLSWGKAKIVDGQGDVLAIFPDINHFMGLSKEQMLGELLFDNPIPSSTVVCRKSALLDIGGFKQPPGLPYVDEPTWLELCLKGEFLPIDGVLGCYRRHEKQVTSFMKTSMIKASRYSIDFFNNLPADARAFVNESVPGLDAKLERKAIEYYYYAGRADLKEGNRSEAQKNFLKALSQGHPTLKAKAMLGLLFNLLRLDMDWLDSLSKRQSFHSQK